MPLSITLIVQIPLEVARVANANLSIPSPWMAVLAMPSVGSRPTAAQQIFLFF